MKKILNIIVFALCSFLFAQAQLVQPVKWSGEELGDSVRLRAAIQPGWHMTIIEFGEREFDEEFVDSFSIVLAKSELTPIRQDVYRAGGVGVYIIKRSVTIKR